MKKVIILLRNLLGICGLMILGMMVISLIYHNIKLSQEDKLFLPMGNMVEVNGHLMHVYVEGEKEETLVFMSGGGTSSPVLDFKSLYSILSDSYRVVVVEKAGYGFSEVVDVQRDLETILQETRSALEKAGIQGPYILCPHSMSGIEALYWAHMYPDEVKAIIGLDMAVPEAYKHLTINRPLLKLSSFAANIGITRWIPGIAESDAIKYGSLSHDEKELYQIIFFRRTATKTMLNEVDEIKENARIVEDLGVPKVPILLFSSNGVGTGWDEAEWKRLQETFIEFEEGEIIHVDASHYVHAIAYNLMAEQLRIYIETLNEVTD